MPELHPNQIQFQAPEPVHVQFAKRDDLLARQIGALGDAFGKLEETKSHIDDVELSEKMRQAQELAINTITEAQRTDNNYQGVKQEALSNVQRLFMEAPEDARIRFSRNNPQFMESLNLAADKVIYQKFQRFENERVSNLIPQMASRVTEGVSDYQTERRNLEQMVANLPNEVAERHLYNFDDAIIKDKIDDLITAGRFQDALDMLDDVNSTYTLSPADRNSKRAVIQQAITQIQAEKQKALDALTKAKEKDENADEKLLTEFLVGVGMENANAYNEVVDAITRPRDAVTKLPNGQYIQGRYIYSADGSLIASLNEVSPVAIAKAINTANPLVAAIPQKQQEIVETINDIQSVHDITIEQLNDDKQNAHHSMIELDNSLKTSGAYKNLTTEQRNDMNDLRATHLRAVNSAFQAPSLRDRTVKYKGLGGAGSLLTGIMSGAIAGGTAGTIAAPGLGTVLGAIGGAALGAAAAPAREWDAPSGAEAAQIGWQTFESAPYDPSKSPWVFPERDDPEYGLPQFNPLANPLSQGNRASQLLADPQRALRQMTEDPRAYYKEKFDIDVQDGTVGEFLFGQWGLLTTASAAELQNLGLQPGLIDGVYIDDVFDKQLDRVRQTKGDLFNKVLSQTDPSELESVNQFLRNLFDDSFIRLQGNIQVNLTDEQKQNRDKMFEWLRVAANDVSDSWRGTKRELKVASGQPENYAGKRFDAIVEKETKRLYK